MADEISWEEATENTAFVKLVPDVEKTLVVSNWRFEKRGKEAPIAGGEVEFLADVLEEDGEVVEEKTFSTTSKRLKTKLRPLFEGKPAEAKIKLSILRVGEQFNTQYSVKELTQQ